MSRGARAEAFPLAVLHPPLKAHEDGASWRHGRSARSAGPLRSGVKGRSPLGCGLSSPACRLHGGSGTNRVASSRARSHALSDPHGSIRTVARARGPGPPGPQDLAVGDDGARAPEHAPQEGHIGRAGRRFRLAVEFLPVEPVPQHVPPTDRRFCHGAPSRVSAEGLHERPQTPFAVPGAVLAVAIGLVDGLVVDGGALLGGVAEMGIDVVDHHGHHGGRRSHGSR